jgi:hypothetical protein
MTVLITLTIAGSDSGPFDLYSNVDGYTTAFETNVSKSALLAGYTSNLVPNGTTSIRVQSEGVCVNYIDIIISTTTTTTTSTTTSSTTTTTTTTSNLGTISIYNYNSSGTIAFLQNVQVNGVDITVDPGTFPLAPGMSAIGTYVNNGGTSQQINVSSSSVVDTPVRVNTSAGYIDCQVSSGYVEFTGVNLSTGPSISVALDIEGSGCV